MFRHVKHAASCQTHFTCAAFAVRKRPLRLLLLTFAFAVIFVTRLAPQQPDVAQPSSAEPAGEALKLSPRETGAKVSNALAAAAAVTFGDGTRTLPEFGVATVPGTSPGRAYLVASVEFRTSLQRSAYRDAEATVFASNDRFADMFLSSEAALGRLNRNPAVVRAEEINRVFVPPPPLGVLAPISRLAPEAIVRGGLNGLTGKGVIVAVIDSGLDFRHPDFITVDSSGNPSSRLLYYWDTFPESNVPSVAGAPAPLAYPNGTPAGKLYTRQRLNEELRGNLRRIPDPDPNSHGTAAAGVAAGNGRASSGRWVGVAPDADLIGVRIGSRDGTIPNMFLLNAIVQWLFQVASAERKPLVISCSFGGQHGARNGQSVFERHLGSHFENSPPGRAILIAAGNERQKALHAQLRFGGSTAYGTLAWCGAQKNSLLQLFFSAPNQTVSASDIVIEPLKLGFPPGSSGDCGPAAAVGILQADPLESNQITRELEGALLVAPGPGGLKIYSRSGRTVNLHAYFAVMSATPSFFYESITIAGKGFPVRRMAEQIAMPGTTRYALTIGSYDFNDQFNGQPMRACRQVVTPGQLSCYTNPGFSRDAVIKPEITAPGEFYTTPSARLTDGTLAAPDASDSSGSYRWFNGTSAATPYAAGVVALMLQKNPNLTIFDVKSYLMRNATRDTITEATPNQNWGYGKLDLAAVQRILAAIPGAGGPPAVAPAKKSGLQWPKN